MRSFFIAICLLFSISAFGQYRSIGTGVWTTLTDSTYVATVQVSADLTGGGFLALDITNGFRVFSGTGQLYEIINVSSPLFFQAILTIKEIGDTEGAPATKVMIFDPNGREVIPQVPFAASGATGQLQAAASSYNARNQKWWPATRYDSLAVVINEVDGSLYVLKAATSTGERPDTSSKWVPIANENSILSVSVSFIDQDVVEDTIISLLNKYQYVTIDLEVTDTVTFDRKLELPFSPDYTTVQRITVNSKVNNQDYSYYIEQSGKYPGLAMNGVIIDKYYLSDDESTDFVIGDYYAFTKDIKNARVTSFNEAKTERFFTNQLVYIGDNPRPFKAVPATYLNHDPTPDTLLNDSIQVIEVKSRDVLNENQIYNSEWVNTNNQINDWTANTGDFNVKNNFALGPFGERNAISAVTKDGNSLLRFTSDSLFYEAGDTISVQLWVKDRNSSANTRLTTGLTSVTAFDSLITYGNVPSEWTYLERTSVATATPAINWTWDITLKGTAEDSILFTMPKVEVARKPTKYYKTADILNGIPGKLYLIPVAIDQPPETSSIQGSITTRESSIFISNGELNIDEIAFPDRYETDAQKFQYAADKCKDTEQCKTIAYSKDHELTDQVNLQGGVNLKGYNSAEIDLNLNDSTKVGFYWVDPAPGSSYVKFRIDNVRFTASSRAKAAFDGGSTFDTETNNVVINGGNFLTWGTIIGRDGELGALNSRQFYTRIQDVIRGGFYFENSGNQHEIYGGGVNTSGYGVYINSIGSIAIKKSNIETCDSSAVYVNTSATRVQMDHVYLEGNCTADTSGRSHIHLNNTATFSYTNGRMSGASDSTEYGFYLPYGASRVESSKIHVGMRLYLGDDAIISTEMLDFERGWQAQQWRTQAWDHPGSRFGSYVVMETNTVYDQSLSNEDRFQSTGIHDGSIIGDVDGVRLGGNIILNSPKLTGFSQNYLTFSDSIVASGSGRNTYSNAALDPYGETMTADIITVTATAGDVNLVTGGVGKTFKQDSTYTFSVWLKNLRLGETQSSRFTIVIGGASPAFFLPRDTNWHRFYYTFVPSSDDSFIDFKIDLPHQGDSIAIWNRQVVDGKYLLHDYVTTAATNNPGRFVNEIIIGGNDTLILDGTLITTGPSSSKYFIQGSGSPQSVVDADSATVFQDTTNAALYFKQSGSGTLTGWVRIDQNIYTSNGTINAGRVVTLSGGASILFDGASTNDIKIGTGYIEAQNNGEIRALDSGDDGRFFTNGEQTQFGSASPFPHVVRRQSSNGTLTTPTDVSSNHWLGRELWEGYYNSAFRQAWENNFTLDSLSTAGNQVYGHWEYENQDSDSIFIIHHDGDLQFPGMSTTYEAPSAYIGLNANKRTVYVKNSLAAIRISGGSTSVTSGSPESITNDTPGTTTDLGSTSDWTAQGDSLEYSGTDARKFEMSCAVDGDLSSTGVITLAIDLNGTPIAASEMDENIGNANAKVDVPLLYVFTVSTNDVLKISVDIDAGTATYTNDNTICTVRAWDQ